MRALRDAGDFGRIAKIPANAAFRGSHSVHETRTGRAQPVHRLRALRAPPATQQRRRKRPGLKPDCTKKMGNVTRQKGSAMRDEADGRAGHSSFRFGISFKM